MADGVVGWDAVLEGHLTAGQRRVLASARIGMAGAGGLGSNCAVFLARTGIRDFVIADPDVVVLSNLNRQHFFPRHLGLPKVDALGAVLRELNPSAVLRLEQVVRGQHQQTGLSLCLCGQRNVNCHLVAVEVGVECRTCQRVQLDSLTLDQFRLERLDTQTVQCRGTVQ